MGIGGPCSYIRAHYTILLIDDGVVCSDEYPYHVYLCLQSLPSVDNLLQKGFKFSTSVGWVSAFEYTSCTDIDSFQKPHTSLVRVSGIQG